MAYIHYDQKSNVAVYVSVYEFYRDGKKVKIRRLENLGRVIDKENGIFSQRGHVFQYTVENGRGEAPGSYAHEKIVPDVERLILDFGDSWFLKEYLSRQPFYSSITNTLPGEKDTLLSLVFYRLLTNKKASCHAKAWYEGYYAYLTSRVPTLPARTSAGC